MHASKTKLTRLILLLVALIAASVLIQKAQDFRRKAAEIPKSVVSFVGSLNNLAIGTSTSINVKVEGTTLITGGSLIVCQSNNLDVKLKEKIDSDALTASQLNYSVEGKICKQYLILPSDMMAGDEKYLANAEILKLWVTKIADGDPSLELLIDKSQMSGIYTGGSKVGFGNASNPILTGSTSSSGANPKAILKFAESSLTLGVNKSVALHIEADSEDAISSGNLYICASKALDLVLNDADKINNIYVVSIKTLNDRDGLSCKSILVLPTDKGGPSSQYLKKLTIASLLITRLTNETQSTIKIYKEYSELSGVTSPTGTIDISDASSLSIDMGGTVTKYVRKCNKITGNYECEQDNVNGTFTDYNQCVVSDGGCFVTYTHGSGDCNTTTGDWNCTKDANGTMSEVQCKNDTGCSTQNKFVRGACDNTTGLYACVQNNNSGQYSDLSECQKGDSQCLKTPEYGYVLKFKMAYPGISKVSMAKCIEDLNKVNIRVMAVSDGGATMVADIYDVPVTKTADLVKRETSEIYAYKGQVVLPKSFVYNSKLTVYIKAKKHLVVKYGMNRQTAPYRNLYGYLGGLTSDAATTPEFDFTGYPLIAGDVVDSAGWVGDDVINIEDFAKFKAEMNTTVEQPYLSDLNGDCKVNSVDSVYFFASLDEKQGQLE